MSVASPAAPAGQKARFGVVFLTIFLDLLGFGMVIPLLPFYGEHFGANAFQVGLLFASYSLAQFVCAPLWGRLSDRVGRRPVLLLSIFGSAVAYAIFAAAPTLAILFLARTAAGIMAANYSIAQAYVADITTPQERAKGMGWVGAAFGMGFVLGPAVGGIIGRFSEAAVPATASVLALLNLGLAILLLPESLPPEARGKAPARHGLEIFLPLGVVRGRPVLGRLLGQYFLVIFCFAVMETTLALYCEQRFGFGHKETAYLLTFVGLLMAAIQASLLGPLVRRFGERPLAAAGMGGIAAGLLVLPAPSLVGLFAGATLLAVGNSLFNPTSLGLISRWAEPAQQGTTMGLSRSVGALGRVLGPVAGGWTFYHLGASWPFWGAGGILALALPPAVAVLRRAQPPQ